MGILGIADEVVGKAGDVAQSADNVAKTKVDLPVSDVLRSEPESRVFLDEGEALVKDTEGISDEMISFETVLQNPPDSGELVKLEDAEGGVKMRGSGNSHFDAFFEGKSLDESDNIVRTEQNLRGGQEGVAFWEDIRDPLSRPRWKREDVTEARHKLTRQFGRAAAGTAAVQGAGEAQRAAEERTGVDVPDVDRAVPRLLEAVGERLGAPFLDETGGGP